jgi:hypothetical protein
MIKKMTMFDFWSVFERLLDLDRSSSYPRSVVDFDEIFPIFLYICQYIIYHQ